MKNIVKFFLLAVLTFQLGFPSNLCAQSLDEILKNHETSSQNVNQNKPVTSKNFSGTTGENLTPAKKDFFDSIFEGIAKFFESLIKLVEKIFNYIRIPTGSSSKPPPASTASNTPQPTTPQPNPGSTPPTVPTGGGSASTPEPRPSSTDSGKLANWKGGKLSPKEFFATLGPAASESFKKTGVPASITLAQAALETGWGKATIRDAKNLFGMKGTGPAGTINVQTREFVNGKYITVYAKFRKYNSWQESIDDHSRLLSKVARYKNCMKNSNNPDQFARELQKAGYATSPTYAKALINIMKQHNLYQFDKK